MSGKSFRVKELNYDGKNEHQIPQSTALVPLKK
jgi:hypothetical protein